jgi:hypothetical protein
MEKQPDIQKGGYNEVKCLSDLTFSKMTLEIQKISK